MPHAFFHVLAICICVLLNYDALVIAAEGSDEPAPACPVPKLHYTDWRSVEIPSIGVRLKMPKRYVEKHWAVKLGNPVVATYQAGHLESFTVEVLPSYGDSLEPQKILPQSDYQSYTECSEVISGHRAVIQSFRGGGVIILGDRRFLPLSVNASFELAPGRTLWFHGSSATRPAQEDLLAIIRTLEFRR